jgi:hypothetical protein
MMHEQPLFQGLSVTGDVTRGSVQPLWIHVEEFTDSQVPEVFLAVIETSAVSSHQKSAPSVPRLTCPVLVALVALQEAAGIVPGLIARG